jgi:ribosomal protein S18 acetylase RimI-like enzyme
MNGIVIRRAKRGDRNALVTLHEALYVTHRDAVLPKERIPLVAYRDFRVVLREDVDAMLANEATAVLVAEREGKIVGYITGTIENEPRRVLARKGVVGDWYVSRALRGQSVGKSLLTTLEAIFLEAGCEVVESQTWSTNDVARRAHEAAGFLEVQVVYRKALGRT